MDCKDVPVMEILKEFRTMAESGDEVKEMEFDRADVNALKKRLRDNPV